MVMGYVKSLLACLRDRSVSMEGNPRVYQNKSQFANETASSVDWGPSENVRCAPVAFTGMRRTREVKLAHSSTPP